MRGSLVLLVACAAPCALAADASWPAYLGSPGSEQYSPLTQINKSNVKQLEIAWTYPSGEKGSYLFNPTVVDGTMYVLAKNNSIVALDAVSGKEKWVHPKPARSHKKGAWPQGGRPRVRNGKAVGRGMRDPFSVTLKTA